MNLQFLVDTGAFYTAIPQDILRKLNIKPTGVEKVRFADGRTARWRLGEARLILNGRSTNTWVLFAKSNTQPLLGAYTLEGLRLTVDPRSKRLKPMPVIIVAVSDSSPVLPTPSRPGRRSLC